LPEKVVIEKIDACEANVQSNQSSGPDYIWIFPKYQIAVFLVGLVFVIMSLLIIKQALKLMRLEKKLKILQGAKRNWKPKKKSGDDDDDRDTLLDRLESAETRCERAEARLRMMEEKALASEQRALEAAASCLDAATPANRPKPSTKSGHKRARFKFKAAIFACCVAAKHTG